MFIIWLNILIHIENTKNEKWNDSYPTTQRLPGICLHLQAQTRHGFVTISIFSLWISLHGPTSGRGLSWHIAESSAIMEKISPKIHHLKYLWTNETAPSSTIARNFQFLSHSAREANSPYHIIEYIKDKKNCKNSM